MKGNMAQNNSKENGVAYQNRIPVPAALQQMRAYPYPTKIGNLNNKSYTCLFLSRIVFICASLLLREITTCTKICEDAGSILPIRYSTTFSTSTKTSSFPTDSESVLAKRFTASSMLSPVLHALLLLCCVCFCFFC